MSIGGGLGLLGTILIMGERRSLDGFIEAFSTGLFALFVGAVLGGLTLPAFLRRRDVRSPWEHAPDDGG
jgi:hypothetical protein